MIAFSQRFIVLLFCLIALPSYAASWQERFQQAEALFEKGQYKEALGVYQDVAENTASQDAQFRIAFIYQQGLGVPVNFGEAARWYTLAGNQGNGAAQNNLSVIYGTGGSGIQQDQALAMHWLKRAAASGEPRAMANLSYHYAEGDGVDKDPYMAYDLANRSAAKGDVFGKFRLAMLYADGIGIPADSSKAVSLLQDVANSEDAFAPRQTAQFLLAETYRIGGGIPANREEAYYWYLLAKSGRDNEISEQSAERVSEYEASFAPDTISSVQQRAKSWRAGIGSTVLSLQEKRELLGSALQAEDYQAAVQLARSLAEQGDAIGQFLLGVMYTLGEGVAKDFDEAVKWIRKAAEQGDADAQFTLGISYERGEGVARDDHEAVYWWGKAAEGGNPSAMYGLGEMYELGGGVSKDLASARKWFQAAAAAADGVTHETMLKSYTARASEGDAASQYWLGVMYAAGRGVQRNEAMAKDLLLEAAKKGYPSAEETLQQLGFTQEPTQRRN